MSLLATVVTFTLASVVMTLRRFDFRKHNHCFSYYYDDVKTLIDHVVDCACDDDSVITVRDTFKITQRLAEMYKEMT